MLIPQRESSGKYVNFTQNAIVAAALSMPKAVA